MSKQQKTAAPPAPAPAPAPAANLPVERNTGALADPALGGAFAEFGGQGFENMGRDELAIPFLTILQSNSPQVKRSDGAYIDGAVEGMIFNNVTKELHDTAKRPLTVICCAALHSYIEWRVREKGGGFVGEYQVDKGQAIIEKCTRDDKSREIMENGNQLNDTRTFYVLTVDDEGVPQPAVISMTSTQIKKARQWNMQMNLLRLKDANGRPYTPPIFASMWHLATAPESNEKGSWFGWKFDFGGYLAGRDDPLFIEALNMHKSVRAGAARADMAESGGDGVGAPQVDPETGEIVGASDGKSDF